MGWTRDKSPRLYREAGGSIVVVFPSLVGSDGHIGTLANVYSGSRPSLVSVAVSRDYIRNRLKRVEFSDLSKEWQAEIRHYFDGEGGMNVPEKERGFWKVENFGK